MNVLKTALKQRKKKSPHGIRTHNPFASLLEISCVTVTAIKPFGSETYNFNITSYDRNV
jgi:hypothetical protein